MHQVSQQQFLILVIIWFGKMVPCWKLLDTYIVNNQAYESKQVTFREESKAVTTIPSGKTASGDLHMGWLHWHGQEEQKLNLKSGPEIDMKSSSMWIECQEYTQMHIHVHAHIQTQRKTQI